MGNLGIGGGMKPTTHQGEVGGRPSRLGLSGLAPQDDDRPSDDAAGAAVSSDAATRALPRASPTMLAGRPLLDGLSIRFLRENGIYVYETEGCARAAIADASKLPLLEPLAWTLHRDLHPELAELDTILSALKRVAAEEPQAEPAQVALTAIAETEEETVESLKDLASGAPIVRAVNEVLELALERRSTDIHLEPVRGGMRVRIRVDGILTTLRTFAPDLARPIVSRVKILAGLNIAERRLPQDGRMRVRVQGRDVDVRIATMPTTFGEAAILRLLERDKGIQGFDQLGLSPGDFELFSRALKAPHGMIVVTGPTGSGKTTTLAAALAILNDLTRKILTIEDPIEYEIDGISQTQVKPAIGLTFANALRAFLRQDPDVIMIGEMRDAETARVAIQASLTGHLVLTTLHTNTAAAAITRLIDLGLEPFLLSASLQSIVAQRLVRLLCVSCRRSVRVPADLGRSEPRYRALGLEGKQVFEAKGCERCAGTGYTGRRAVFEVLNVTDEIRHMISIGATEAEIEGKARAHGMTTLIEDGVRAALAGETSLQEVLRVTASR
jgi:general secretion pathway protein E